jgi:hypothetical protein
MKKHYVIIFIAVLLTSVSFGQESSTPSKVNLGLGMGLDYGGFGGRFSFVPAKNFALFAGFGYNLLDLGYNVGGTFRMLPDKRICPTISAMYGYTAVIKIDGAAQFNKTYYGPSFSFGIEFRPQNKGYWNLELIVPVRPKEYHDTMDALKDDPDIEIKSEPLPIGICVGYHFWL